MLCLIYFAAVNDGLESAAGGMKNSKKPVSVYFFGPTFTFYMKKIKRNNMTIYIKYIYFFRPTFIKNSKVDALNCSGGKKLKHRKIY